MRNTRTEMAADTERVAKPLLRTPIAGGCGLYLAEESNLPTQGIAYYSIAYYSVRAFCAIYPNYSIDAVYNGNL